MPVIPVNRVVDNKRIIGKNGGRGGGEARGIADPKRYHFRTENPPLAMVEVVFSLTYLPRKEVRYPGQQSSSIIVIHCRHKKIVFRVARFFLLCATYQNGGKCTK
jgi:hypothetical protein